MLTMLAQKKYVWTVNWALIYVLYIHRYKDDIAIFAHHHWVTNLQNVWELSKTE